MMTVINDKYIVDYKSTEIEKNSCDRLVGLIKQTTIPDDEILGNLGLFLKRHTLSRILFMQELYKQIINVNGSIVEFGVRWGQNMALFESFRGMYEPYNYTRKIIGFDTFSGFPEIDQKDGSAHCAVENGYSVTDCYEAELEMILKLHENLNPVSHIRTTELIKGDATKTFPHYLQKHPELLVSLVYFDFDIYKPTKICLELIKRHLVKGAVVA